MPNNLGPTLLLIVGLMISPLLIGMPLVLLGLSRVRTAEGRLALPQLAAWRRCLRRRLSSLIMLLRCLPAAAPKRHGQVRRPVG